MTLHVLFVPVADRKIHGSKVMKKIVVTMGFTALAAFLASNILAADNKPAEVRIETSRIVKTDGGVGVSGARRKVFSLAYEVSLDDIDVTTKDGLDTATKRINTAAMGACKEIAKEAPEANPSDEACARDASKRALKELNAAIAASKSASK